MTYTHKLKSSPREKFKHQLKRHEKKNDKKTPPTAPQRLAKFDVDEKSSFSYLN